MGRLLAYARNTFLVYEPFNQDWGLFGVPRKFPYLRGRVDAEASEARLLHRYPRARRRPVAQPQRAPAPWPRAMLRNSAALATAWQAIRSADQRQSVRDICEPPVEDHYSEW